MSEKDDKFVKLSFHKHMKKQEVELSNAQRYGYFKRED